MSKIDFKKLYSEMIDLTAKEEVFEHFCNYLSLLNV